MTEKPVSLTMSVARSASISGESLSADLVATRDFGSDSETFSAIGSSALSTMAEVVGGKKEMSSPVP